MRNSMMQAVGVSNRLWALAIVALAGSALPCSALTPPALMLSDGHGNSVTIDYTGAMTYTGICNAVTCPGVAFPGNGRVGWSGTIGTIVIDTIQAAVGRTNAASNNNQIDLGIGSVTSISTTSETITASWTVPSLAVTGPVQLSTITSGATVTYTAYVDPSNTPFGTGTGTEVGQIAGVSSNANSPSIPYSATSPSSSVTEVAVITLPPGGTGTIDFAFNAALIQSSTVTLTCPASMGAVNSAYSSALVAAGGFSPYNYSILSGSLPNGLSLNASTGAIAGTPTAGGAFSFTAKAVDSGSVSAQTSATASCLITVETTPTASCAVINAVVNVPITPVTLTAMGGTGSGYTFSASGLPTGLSISGTGTISGTPTVTGTFPYTVTIKDSAGNTGTVNCSVTVNTPPTTNCVTINAVQGTPITPVTLVGTGGAGAPYTFTATNLPNGLTISSGGTISGTPTATGTSNYTVTVKDSAGNIGTMNCSVTVYSMPTASCAAITAVQGTAITPVTLNASGGAGGPYTFTATGLPNGLTISTSGTISGTSTVNGTFPYTVTITDNAGHKGTVNCSVTVTAPVPPTLVCSSTSTGTVGTAFNSPALSVSGGTAPYTFSVASGSLPAGLSLNSSTGAITGTPTAGGSFTIKVTDKTGLVAATTCPYTINNVVVTPLSLLCAGGTATVGSAYSSTLAVTGGVGPYTFSIAAGALPGGLTLNASTGVISGTPTGAGSFGYTAKVVDHNGTVAYSNCTGSCTAGSPLSWNLRSKLGNLGNSYSWTSGGIALKAYGYNNNGSATALYAKNESSTESGLGIASDGDFEINTSTFIQLDVTALEAAGVSNAQISFNSVQSGESWKVYGSNTLGTLGTFLSGGSSQGVLMAMPGYGVYKYIGITAGAANIDIAAVASTAPTTCSINVAPAPLPKITMTKTASETKVNPFEPVTYTYKVTNTGTTTVTGITVTDDNGTPGS